MSKVSVIMPVYNAEKYLEETLHGLVKQTLQEIEIICIDDGSTDTSSQILDEWRKKDSRIMLLSQKNKGAGAARNLGISRASGEYLSILDADDRFEPDMLQAAYEKAKNMQADVCVFKMDRFTEQSGRRQPCHWSLSKWQLPDFEPFTYQDLKENIFKVFVGWTWDKLFRREFVREQGLVFQPLRTSNDLFFTFSALVKAKKITVLSRTLIHQRTGRQDSLSVTREQSWHCFYDALLALREELLAMGIYEQVERSYINYALHFSLWNLNTLSMPTFETLYGKLAKEYFAELGITKKCRDYYWNREEYKQYEQICLLSPMEYRIVNGLEPDGPKPPCDLEILTQLNEAYGDTNEANEANEANETYRTPDFQQKKYRAYREALEQISEDGKWEFVSRMRTVFLASLEKKELSQEAFEDTQWDELLELLERPQDYYLHWYQDVYKRQVQALEQELADDRKEKAQLAQALTDSRQKSAKQKQEQIRLGLELEKAEREKQRLEQELSKLCSSRTWKLGRMVTYVPRKLLGRP